MDFLQADHIGIELIQDLGNPRRAAPAIHTDALMNVIAHRGKNLARAFDFVQFQTMIEPAL